ncbi:MAG: efflux RND transporter periplasmic adaptor subunit [Chloroherpetonaceae bacterium]|nr:efflux RND transporter periplasmic adaptor subunit [Chloroherpetonaceae bacterium]
MKAWAIRFSVAAAILFLISLVVFRATSKTNLPEQSSEQNLPEVRVEPIRVKTIVAKRKTLVQSISTTGIAEANRRVQISARISAELVRLSAKEGEFCRAGETLLQFNDKEFRIALQEAKEEYLKTQSEYVTQRLDYAKLSPSAQNIERLQRLRKELEEAERALKAGKGDAKEVERLKEEVEFAEILAGEKLDEVLRTRTGFAHAKNQLQRAELNLQNTIIRAPFDGFVSGIKVAEGQFVTAGQVCMEFVNLSRIRVEVGILEKEVPLIKVQNRARVVFNAFPKDTLIGRVTAVSPVVSTETKTAKAMIELPNPRYRIKPGMYTTVWIEVAFFQNCLVVPKRAIVERDGRKVVFVAQKEPDGRELAKWHYVETGAENENEVEILEGLEEGDEIIVENNFTLSHDMPIVKIP